MSRSGRSRIPYNGSETNLVISLDIGTSFSGASWAFLSPGKDPYICDVEESRRDIPVAKVPTVLYYDRGGILQAAGSETLNKWIIQEALDQKWTRVERLKLLLRPDSLAHQIDKAQLPPNKTLVTMIADFLRYMVNLASEHFRETMDAEGKIWEEVKNSVIYILSYSNGWNTFQHSLMRDAAVEAEIIPNSDGGRRRIKFVPEGEASLHWCIKTGVGLRRFSVGSQYIVVDAGGGTIDISSFKSLGTSERLEFEESSIPECHLQGSMLVTQAFSRYVQAKLGGSSFEAPKIIDQIVESFDQLAMQTFKDHNEVMPVKFGQYQDNDPKVNIIAGKLLVPGMKMAEFYEPASSAIVASVKAKVVPTGKAIVVLVGGFSRNEYLFLEVRRRLYELGLPIQVLRGAAANVKPSAHGALCFYLDRAVEARMAKGTYGVSYIHDFDPKDPKHVERISRVQKNQETGRQYIEGGFFVAVKKGTVIQETELTRFPSWYTQSNRTAATLDIRLECYQGDVTDIKFRDEDSEERFQELCSFKAVIPETALVRGTKKKRGWRQSPEYYYVSNLQIAVAFGATEFECYIEWRDKKGVTQRQPIIPIWNDVRSSMLNVQNNQEKAPDIEHTPPSLSSNMQPSDGPDRPVSGSDMQGSDLASLTPRPWERDSSHQFLNSQSVCTPKSIGAPENWVVYACSGVLLFTLPSGVITYNTKSKTSGQINLKSAAHNLSPDGNTLVRWIFDENGQPSSLQAIDVKSTQKIAELQQSHTFQQCDILNAVWIDDVTIYIPVSAEGVIVPWNIQSAVLPNNHLEDLEVVEPLPSITCHSILKFEITKSRSWWTATGITFDPPSGLIEVHDVKNDESRIVEGMVSCIAEVGVNDEENALLVSAGVTQDYKLQLRVQQLDLWDSGHHFPSIDVKIDTIEEKDYPRDITVLHPLPIVAVMTEKCYGYFFELNTGAYLYSQAQKSYQVCPGQSNKREIWLWSHEESDVKVLRVNEGDLIGYCRTVLKDDSLASAIASRTGLSEDVILESM